jgi:hypothetical protein
LALISYQQCKQYQFFSNKGSEGDGKRITKSARAGLQFPVGKVANKMKSGLYAERINKGAPIFLAAVLEYIAAGTYDNILFSIDPYRSNTIVLEVLALSGNATKDNKKVNTIDNLIILFIIILCNRLVLFLDIYFWRLKMTWNWKNSSKIASSLEEDHCHI